MLYLWHHEPHSLITVRWNRVIWKQGSCTAPLLNTVTQSLSLSLSHLPQTLLFIGSHPHLSCGTIPSAASFFISSLSPCWVREHMQVPWCSWLGKQAESSEDWIPLPCGSKNQIVLPSAGLCSEISADESEGQPTRDVHSGGDRPRCKALGMLPLHGGCSCCDSLVKPGALLL